MYIHMLNTDIHEWNTKLHLVSTKLSKKWLFWQFEMWDWISLVDSWLGSSTVGGLHALAWKWPKCTLSCQNNSFFL